MNAIIYNMQDLEVLLKTLIAEAIKEIKKDLKDSDPDKIYNVKQAAKYLYLSEKTIRRKVQNGKIVKAYPDVARLRFTKQELDRYKSLQ